MTASAAQQRWAVLAVGLRWEIGLANALPWKLPADLARFRRFTTPWPIVMGRLTWDGIGRPLPNRRNLVLSTTLDSAPGAEIVRSLDEVWTRTADMERVMIIGGARLYEQALPSCTHIHLTIVEGEFHADTHLPLALMGWDITERHHYPADDTNAWAQTVCHFQRTAAADGINPLQAPQMVPPEWYQRMTE